MKHTIRLGPPAGWARSSTGLGSSHKIKKVCAHCLKPFHKVKRPKAATVTKPHQGVTDERSICLPCLREIERAEGGKTLLPVIS